MDAGEPMWKLHDRKPVIMDPAAYDAWLDPLTPIEELKPLLARNLDGELRFHPVSRAVNQAKNKGAECIEPINRFDLGWRRRNRARPGSCSATSRRDLGGYRRRSRAPAYLGFPVVYPIRTRSNRLQPFEARKGEKSRWPSMETIAKVLALAGMSYEEFGALVDEKRGE